MTRKIQARDGVSWRYLRMGRQYMILLMQWVIWSVRIHYTRHKADFMANILVIDDSPVTRLKLKQICERFQHTIVGEAANGIDGIRLFKLEKPDLVFLDVMMPEKNGPEVAAEILKLQPNARILMISSDAQHSTVVDVLKKGVRGYILKPFQDERVISEIQRALS